MVTLGHDGNTVSTAIGRHQPLTFCALGLKLTPDLAGLGWEAKVDLENGLQLSLEYFPHAVAEKERIS